MEYGARKVRAMMSFEDWRDNGAGAGFVEALGGGMGVVEFGSWVIRLTPVTLDHTRIN